jgi:protein-tyrosine phosphatase
VVDLHCHVLPGLDDGPRTLDGSLALARAAAEEGTRTLVATPHVNHRYPTSAAMIRDGVARVNRALREGDIPVEVALGAEIAHDTLPRLREEELHALTLGGGPNVLLEAPLGAVGPEFELAFDSLRERGFGVVIAHPERCPSFHRDPDRLGRLVGRGALCSITASAYQGVFGKQVRALAERLLADGLVHDVASDAHDATRRPPALRSALLAADGRLDGVVKIAAWVTENAPAAILSGDPLPPAPPFPRRRRSRRLGWSR